MSLIRISESDDWIVDYDKERGMYRVSYFKDGHFVDELWFDAYEEKEICNCVMTKNTYEYNDLWLVCECGYGNMVHSRYCGNCGKKLNVIKAKEFNLNSERWRNMWSHYEFE